MKNYKNRWFSIVIIALSSFLCEASILKTGDVVDIRVIGYSELSGRYSVQENGTIDYPLLTDEVIVNISTSELMNELVFRLVRHIDNPLVLVSVVERPEIKVTVLGMVADPGPVVVYKGASVQEAVQKAGGLLPTSNLEQVKLYKRGSTTNAQDIDLKTFFRDGKIDNIPSLDDDDILVVLGHERSRKIKVIGSVQKPGSFELDEKSNVFELIYMAGGPTERADLSRVRLLSSVDGKTSEVVLDIQSLIDKGDMDNMPDVQAGDVILVYSRWFDWRTMLSVMNNTLLFILTIQTFAGLFK